MRDLHVVAVSEDGRHVVLATRRNAGSGQFRVAVDDRLAAALRGESPRPAAAAPSSLTPRDIQSRLRAGESVEQLAQSAGVPLERVERYAGPVLAERERVVDGARGAVVHRPRLGPSSLPLAQAVERNLADNPAYQPDSARWSARREDSGGWVVELSWSARGRRRTSAWRYDLRTRELTPIDASSAALGHVDPGGAPAPAVARPSRPAARRPAATPGGAAAAAGARPAREAAGGAVPAAPATAAARAATTKTTRQTAPRTPAVTAEAGARPAGRGGRAGAAAAPAAAAGRQAPTGAAATGRAAAKTVRRAAPPATATGDGAPTRSRERPAPRRPVARAAVPPAPPAAPSGPPTLRVVPSAPEAEPGTAAGGARPPSAPPVRRVVGEREAVADWADVLFGAAPAPTPHGERSTE